MKIIVLVLALVVMAGTTYFTPEWNLRHEPGFHPFFLTDPQAGAGDHGGTSIPKIIPIVGNDGFWNCGQRFMNELGRPATVPLM